MKLQIKPVTSENRSSILELRVSQNQQHFIESTAQCLEDAQACSVYEPVGLYANDVLVGFAMYGLFPREGNQGRLWIDRFLIAEAYQGQGLGYRMLDALIVHLNTLYPSSDLYLSLFKENEGALHLYKKFDFHFNGELDINGEQVMVRSYKQLPDASI